MIAKDLNKKCWVVSEKVEFSMIILLATQQNNFSHNIKKKTKDKLSLFKVELYLWIIKSN